MSPFREIAVNLDYNPPNRKKASESPTRSAQISRGRGAQSAGYRPTRVLHATVPSSSGPARKHTAKFEPTAWNWSQKTSGSGAPKGVLSEETFKLKLQRPN